MRTVTYRGISGSSYHFLVTEPHHAIPTSSGLYLLVKDQNPDALGLSGLFQSTSGPSVGLGLGLTPEATRFKGLYVGKATNLRERVGVGLRRHHKLPDAIWAGMTNVAIQVLDVSEAKLARRELDLIRGNPDWLNGLSPIFAALQ